MNHTTWTIVSDSGQAIIYEGAPMGSRINKVHTLTNKDATKDKKDLETDRPGQSFNPSGIGSDAMTKEVNATEHATKVFAKKVADYLQQARSKQLFTRLIIVSEPSFLGELRSSLDEPTLKLVISTVDRNITDLNPKQVSQFIQSNVQL